MAHFAKLGAGNIVERVEVVSNDIATTEQAGVDFLNNLYKTRDVWKQTSYNGNIRKNFAGKGYIYDQTRDAFIPPKTFNSWVLNETTCRWEAPVAKPTLTQEQIYNNNYYKWNEQNQVWDLAHIPKPFNSWIKNEDTGFWEAPVAYPNDGQRYNWNEQNQTWDLIDNS